MSVTDELRRLLEERGVKTRHEGHEGIWLEYRPTYADHWSGYKRVGDLVRCRDCKYYTPECVSREEREYGVYEDVWEPGGCFNPERRPHVREESGGWHVVGIDTQPDGFCAWGERREVGE